MANIVNQYGQVKVGVRVQSSGGGGIDADAQAFITAASITDSTQQSAINTLVTQLKGYGIWTKMKALYPFVGGTASSHKFNLKDPRDLDAAFRLIFSGGWTHSSNGAQPNGSTAYADTKLAPSSMGQNSIHASFYSRTNTLGQMWDLGSYDAGGGVVIGVKFISNTTSVVYTNTKSGNSNIDTNPTTGLYMASRTSNSTNYLYRNGTLLVSGTNTSFPPNNLNIYLAADNEGTPAGFSTRQQAFASIGDGLTDAEAVAFYTAVQTFQSTLGRQV